MGLSRKVALASRTAAVRPFPALQANEKILSIKTAAFSPAPEVRVRMFTADAARFPN